MKKQIQYPTKVVQNRSKVFHFVVLVDTIHMSKAIYCEP